MTLKVVVAAFLLAFGALPFAHHDLACHLKSSTHCAVCHVGTAAEDSTAQSSFFAVRLADAGVVEHRLAHAWAAQVTSPSSDRAPPSDSPSL
jgi:hypothetical protein